ncbi:hypothetical protein MHL31_15185 [Lutibacter sp. A80]|uniref:hypothetical protein n=1 Tax=Lutibacter sp. A80 TaxID=2918453 RepID=UPI001F064784|nr:hypothetical protein [Lutibacter sp. A80]UMB60414.1 hypothetical protein MHL31_15185 [Lutibacter sp. A80]
MNSILLMIGPFEIIAVLAVIVSLFFSSLYLVSRHEKGRNYFIWLLLIIFLPILGSVCYLVKHLANLPSQKRDEHANNVL